MSKFPTGLEMLFNTLVKSLKLDPEQIKTTIAGMAQIVAGLNGRLDVIERRSARMEVLICELARINGITIPASDDKPAQIENDTQSRQN